MKLVERIVTAAVATLAVFLVVLVGSGSATASPLLAPPPATQTLSEASELDGQLVAPIKTKEVHEDIHAATREELTYGTGVLRGSEPEAGTATVFTPVLPDGEVVVYAQPPIRSAPGLRRANSSILAACLTQTAPISTRYSVTARL